MRKFYFSLLIFQIMNKIKVTYLITGLNVGGAENMLYKLLAGYDKSRFEMSVISLTDKGKIGEKIEKLGCEVYALNMRKNLLFFRDCWRLISYVRKKQPDIICGWMYHADLVASIVKIFIHKPKLLWNIRQTFINSSTFKFSTRMISKICAFFSSSSPNKIIYCAHAAAHEHEKLGYAKNKAIVIPNGFDLSIFKPDIKCRDEMRDELKIPTNSFVIGTSARFHPIKDYATFVKAAKIIATNNSQVCFVCCGDGMSWDNPELKQWIDAANLQKYFYLLGRRNDMPRVLHAFDVLVSSSVTEGFSNTIGEAMACGIACVVTDVGDSSIIVGDKDLVVQPRDPEALAKAVIRILNFDEAKKKTTSEFLYQRIRENYAIESIIDQYQKLFMSVIQ